jgi:AcrR family transcriptional regulator
MQLSETSGHGKSATEKRILTAAAGLFSKLGYNGVSTRDIASAAEVNEVTIYRHYPRKRDLYVAVLAAELGRVSLRGDLLAEIAKAPDARAALTCTFDLIATTLTREPELLRLLLYSSLELRKDLEVLMRKHLGELVEVLARYLDPWVARGDLRSSSSRGLVFALISIVLFHRPLHLAFSAEPVSPEITFEAFVEICLGIPLLVPDSAAGSASGAL